MSRTSIYRTSIHRRSYNHQDPFPLLDFKEISVCLQSCEFTANEELVSKPTSQYIRSLTEQLLDTFMGVSVDSIEQKVKAYRLKDNEVNSIVNGATQSDEANKETTSTINDTSLSLIVMFRAANEFYSMCGITDFSLIDLMKPDSQRIRRILSAVVNFARFREENSIDIENLVALCEGNLGKIKSINDENIAVQNNIDKLKNELESYEAKTNLKQINIYNTKLENELKKLKRQQELLTNEHAQYKNEKTRLIEKLEDSNYLIIEANNQIENLKDYDKINLEVLQKIIEDLKANYKSYQDTLSDYDIKNRNVLITIESVQALEQELKSYFRILEEIFEDINQKDEINDKLTKYQEFLDQQNLTTNDLKRQIQQLNRQLAASEDKISKLKLQSQDRITQSKGKLNDLKLQYDKLLEERSATELELNKRKESIYEMENKITLAKLEFQNEVKTAELAIAKLNSHLKLYLTEMNMKLN